MPKKNNIFFEIFAPDEPLPKNVILPKQVHKTKIVEIVSGDENLEFCDGIWTKNPKFLLGIRSADCAAVGFFENEKVGIAHVGWRGLVDGMCEKMLIIFPSPKIFVAPILPKFEIQRDECFHRIRAKFGYKFLEISHNFSKKTKKNNEKIIFDFRSALANSLLNAKFDNRSTFLTSSLASWRRDRDFRRNIIVAGLRSI